MSERLDDYQERLNIREQIARIDRNMAEQAKLHAEAHKFNRDPWILVLAALIAAVAALIARLPEILAAFH